MTFTTLNTLPVAETIKNRIPLPKQGQKNIAQNRQEIFDILSGKDQRLIVIVGPCSAWPNSAVIEYAKSLANAAKPFAKNIKIVLRAYTQKPRTTLGWKGSLLHPNPFDEPNIIDGISYCREMMIEIINSTGLAIADEILYPDLCLQYLGDLYSYGCIGARSSEHQRKRMIASGIEHAMGMKNPTSGDLTKAVQSVQVAQAAHKRFPHIGNIVETSGNPYAHLVLRGGGGRPNYYPHMLDLSNNLLQKQGCKNPAIIVDTSHENSLNIHGKKDPKQQITVAKSVLQYRQSNPDSHIKGIMIESFIHEGAQKNIQKPSDYIFGTSITDSCLSLNQTIEFLHIINQYCS